MFEAIMNAITTTVTLAKGCTGYLDEVQWSSVPVKGIDNAGRPFFSLPLITKKDERHGGLGSPVHSKESRGMVTFFKRFTDPTHPVWVTADSHTTRGYANPTIRGALENPANGDIEDLLLRVVCGETVEFVYEDKKNPDEWGRFSRTTRLMTPEEVRVATDALLEEGGKGLLRETA